MSNRADGPRAAVVAEAESWIGTPYHHAARVKGAGCDCLTLLAEVFERAGVIAPIEVPFYPPDWHLHRSAELYMNGVVAHAREIEHSPRTGDIALFRFGRCFAHGAIVTQWPRLISCLALGRGRRRRRRSATPRQPQGAFLLALPNS